jgi:hypothetical protein
MYLHIQLCNTDVYKKCIVNVGTKSYRRLCNYIKELDKYRFFNMEWRYFLLQHALYSLEENMILNVVRFSL